MSERDILVEILNSYPFPKHVKRTQKLDEYIKQYLSEKEKSTALNKETTLKETQKKVASILGSLARLWSILEAEQKIFSEDADEAVSGDMEISRLFEQTSLLICKKFDLITY